ncbi:magnesium chelatase domain-containing protein [Gulosibacter sp. 10]|uniref:magnesium chelatase domain-containing protein n=1 Tax=Gulosibacter sp. 10 TaxID=1255570 RepID=UPI00097EC459|nr:magnesium chelatase domain-containing protein [Gulosibacter sp. 10]SJM68492.1 MG(2+) CHELATASE FAMILY PROTEIN / ComM-related protein [Gulosibacter sp. 10]
MTARTCRAWAIALEGLGGHPVEVETHVAEGLPRFVLIGLPDASLGEAVDRIRAALNSTGHALPARRVTTNMSPASLRKHGSGFDLAIAASILAATGLIHGGGPEGSAHIGELALNGAVRSVRGVLPAVLAARNAGFERVLVPAECRAEAELVTGIEVVPIATLRSLALHYGADPDLLSEAEEDAPPQRTAPSQAEASTAGQAPPDLRDVIGQEDAIRALAVAAAGGHHLYFIGPPGVVT